jgi:hypothetical protein
MTSPSAHGAKLPFWVRLVSALWLLIWVPAYWRTWGVTNFLQLCDVAAILTGIGLLTGNALLLSSQALASLLIDLAWAIDAAGRLLFGRTLIGGTEYLFDAQYPLWVRLLSLFHLALPLLLIWALLRVGYDRRALALQSAITLVVFSAVRFTSAAKNMNFAFRDPFFHRAWGPPPVHILVSVLFMIVVVYLPTHTFLEWLEPKPRP